MNILAPAQSQPGSRITQPIDDHIRVTLRGNVHPLAQARNDQGAVPDAFLVERMLLLVQRPPERESALRQFLQDAHTPHNPRYHKWVTPQQFAERYGAGDEEIAAVTGWLQKHGFSVARVTRGKTAIEFSGNAGQLRAAFHTEIHAYLVNGEAHHANNVDPEIPAALAPVVAGITPMNDFRPKSYMKVLGKAVYDPKKHTLTPLWTTPFSSPLIFAVAPGDLAVQYDVAPLYTAGIDGTGVTIGIIGASDVEPTVIANYRSFFGLPAVNFNAVIDGIDPTPGQGNWATGESYLDVEEAGALAPGASINLYTAADTSVQSGFLLAAQRAVDDDQAPVLSTSYGTCEQDLGASGNQFFAALWEQAAAQGQTSFVSSGDGGSAGCDNFDLEQPAQYGLAVNGFSSSPWNVSVGGTDFYYSSYNGSASAQQAQLANYWNVTPTELPATSLLQPVPEQPWNRAFGLNLYDGGVYDPNAYGQTIVAGSGGVSTIYSKPAWQSGRGVPADGMRDLPDLSLFAAVGENDSFYPVCFGVDECLLEAGGGYEIAAVGGTSASTPAIAGIMALINQKYGPQGQAGFILYPLAIQHPAVFHDVTVGSNNVPCQSGTADCSVSTLKDNTNGLDTLGQYYATAGYDEASGLGSVDANLLVQYWNSLSFTPTSTTLKLSQETFPHGTPVTVQVAVSGTGGTPSGDVGLVTIATPASNTSLSELTLASGAASSTVDNLPGGQYRLTAKYTGDTVFAPSNSQPVTLNVAAENSTVSVYGSSWSNSSNAFVALTNGGSYPYGTYIALNAQPRGVNATQGSADGLATGTVTFTDAVGGGSLSSGAVNISREGIAEWVPALTIPTGTNNLSVSYSGDASFGASSSTTPFTLTITKATPFSFLDSKPSPVAVGSVTQLYFSASAQYVSPLPAPPDSTYAYSSPASPTGTVTFSLGNTVLGTVPLLPNYNNLYGSEVTLNVATLPLGTDTVTAAYSGDGNYTPATSTFNVVVEQAPTLAASANPSVINWGEFTAITATVAGVSGMPVPTGTINYFAAGAGSDWTDTETLNNGSATSIPLTGGLFFSNPASVAVSYSGDSVYGPANVNVNFTVTQANLPPFSISGTPLTIAAGATTGNVSSITVTPENGFTGSVYFSCALTSSPNGAIHLPSCSATPSINVTGASPVAATMTISSTAPTTTTGALEFPLRNGSRRFAMRSIAMNGGMVVTGFFLLGILPRRRNRQRIAGLLLVLAVLGILVGCGGRNGNGGGGGQQIPGTTAGNYTFTLNAALSAGGVTQSQTTVTVTIQ
ncbi:MAG: Ig-like domain repeat protein [Candidatus Sulfotelmatobacter sp.]